MAVNAVEMSTKQWIEVPDNPRQRNTHKRARMAARKHLSNYQKPHRFVFAAVRNGQVLCKLDGHTRALLWQMGELSDPPEGTVVVNLIEVSSIAEAKQVYDMLDSPPSVKKPSDTIFGACRENGFELYSPLLRSCQFSTQLKIAESGRFSGDLYKMVKKWKPVLVDLDKLSLTSNYTILISAMLLTINRDRTDAHDFWQKLDAGEGEKHPNKGYCGVQLLHDVMRVRRAEGTTAGWENLLRIVGQSLSAYEMFKSGKHSNRTFLKSADIGNYIVSREKSNASK